jgi:hypothetical protein
MRPGQILEMPGKEAADRLNDRLVVIPQRSIIEFPIRLRVGRVPVDVGIAKRVLHVQAMMDGQIGVGRSKCGSRRTGGDIRHDQEQ